MGGGFEQHIITYDTIAENLVQKWIPIDTYKWDYADRDLRMNSATYLIFMLDEDNRVAQEVDLRHQFITRYFYLGPLLCKKERYKVEGNYIDCWKYLYEGENISRIDHYHNLYGDVNFTPEKNDPVEVHYYTDGLLDSTVILGNVLLHYKYVYN